MIAYYNVIYKIFLQTVSSFRFNLLRSFSFDLMVPFDVDLPLDKEALDWNTRMKIAAGAAKGLEYLHDKANPPVIYRDFKSSNILLGEGFHPKLSDFGLAKLGPVGDKSHVSTRVMGTYGYCAPEYAMTGQLTVKSDVYSFGVVLLELITGRKAIDSTRPASEQNLVSWVSLFKLFMNHLLNTLNCWVTSIFFVDVGLPRICLESVSNFDMELKLNLGGV